MKNIYYIEGWEKETAITIWRSAAFLDKEKAEYYLLINLNAEGPGNGDIEYTIITLPIAE